MYKTAFKKFEVIWSVKPLNAFPKMVRHFQSNTKPKKREKGTVSLNQFKGFTDVANLAKLEFKTQRF